MKTIKLFLAGALVAGAVAVNAQDSTNVATPPAQPQEQTQPQDQTPAQDQTNFKKDMVVIQASEVPASLRTTLQGAEYKGWESGTVYRSQNNDIFIVETRDGDKTKIHRFDKSGKAVKDY